MVPYKNLEIYLQKSRHTALVRFSSVTFLVTGCSWEGSLEAAVTLLTGFFFNGNHVLGGKHR